MAFVHGKNVNFQLDDSGGVIRDISAYLTKVDFPRTADTAETSTFGSTDKSFIAGLKSATISIEGLWDATVDAYLAGIIGLIGSFIYGPAGSTGGNVKYSGECLCTAYNPPAGMSGAVTFTATLQITGAVSRGTY